MSTPPQQARDSRLVRVEVEVPGAPEQVWEAIATGPGIGAWFVPAEVEEREGGAITTDHGVYGDSTGVVTVWEPPRRFAFEERDWQPSGAGAPPWVTEIRVEPADGGACAVRLVSGIHSGAGDWGDQIDPTEAGWRDALDNLRVHLTHFAGQRAASARVTVTTSASPGRAWAALAGPLGLEGAAVGDRVQSQAGAPPLRGAVERAAERSAAVRAEQPAAGLVQIGADRIGEETHVTFRAYLYGEQRAAAAAEQERLWQAWLQERLPDATGPAGDVDHDESSAESFPSSDPPSAGGPGL